MVSIIRPRKAAGMIGIAIGTWPSKGMRSCVYHATKCCGMLLPCDAESKRRSMNAPRIEPPHPTPLSIFSNHAETLCEFRYRMLNGVASHPQPFSPAGEREQHSPSPAGEKGARESSERPDRMHEAGIIRDVGCIGFSVGTRGLTRIGVFKLETPTRRSILSAAGAKPRSFAQPSPTGWENEQK